MSEPKTLFAVFQDEHNMLVARRDDYDTVADGLVRALDALERVERLLLDGGEHRVADALAVLAEVRE